MDFHFSQWFQFQEKQQEAVALIGRCRYIFYGGARGGGKTDCAIGLAYLVALYYPGIKIAIVRRTLIELRDQIIPRFLQIVPESLGIYKYAISEKTVKFWNGSTISFTSIEHAQDVTKEQGIERQFYIVDEGPLFEEIVIRKLIASMRNTRIKGINGERWMTTLFITGNPGGISDRWFKDYFINPNYERWKKSERAERRHYAFVKANVRDNKILMREQPEYIDQLDGLPEHLRAAWLEGRWDIFAGKFFEEWNEQKHVLSSAPHIPSHWLKWIAVDQGKGSQNHPSVCLWFAQNPQTGRVVCYRELLNYDGGDNDGFAREVKRLTGDEELFNGLADPNMFAKSNREYDVAHFFSDNNVFIQKSDNSRQSGWMVLKQWLHWTARKADGSGGMDPMLQFAPSCQGVKECFADLMYTKSGINDANTKMYDDPADAARYGMVMLPYGHIWLPNGATKPMTEIGDITDEELRQWQRERDKSFTGGNGMTSGTLASTDDDGYVPDEYVEPSFADAENYDRNYREEELYSQF